MISSSTFNYPSQSSLNDASSQNSSTTTASSRLPSYPYLTLMNYGNSTEYRVRHIRWATNQSEDYPGMAKYVRISITPDIVLRNSDACTELGRLRRQLQAIETDLLRTHTRHGVLYAYLGPKLASTQGSGISYLSQPLSQAQSEYMSQPRSQPMPQVAAVSAPAPSPATSQVSSTHGNNDDDDDTYSYYYMEDTGNNDENLIVFESDNYYPVYHQRERHLERLYERALTNHIDMNDVNMQEIIQLENRINQAAAVSSSLQPLIYAGHENQEPTSTSNHIVNPYAYNNQEHDTYNILMDFSHIEYEESALIYHTTDYTPNGNYSRLVTTDQTVIAERIRDINIEMINHVSALDYNRRAHAQGP